jgi:hypothetical protein
MDNPEKTGGIIKNGQSRENRRGNQEWTIQRKWQHWVYKTQDEDKPIKHNTMTLASNRDNSIVHCECVRVNDSVYISTSLVQ